MLKYSPAKTLRKANEAFHSRRKSDPTDLIPREPGRRLEVETQRNLELMWLTSRLMPDFKTIARFRKDNGKAIRSVCRQFIELCRQLDLFSQAIVAIDGSKFKAVNNRDKNFTRAKSERASNKLRTVSTATSKHWIQQTRKNLLPHKPRPCDWKRKSLP